MEAGSEPMSSDPSKHLQELGERLDKLRTGERFCDITISVKGKEFKAHKAVLAATSPFFLTLLTSDMKESNEQLIRIELEEATEAVMEDVFKYVYTGNVLVTEERAHNLIATANYLLLPGFKTMAGNFLKDIVTTENCIFNYYFAEKYQCLELKEKSRQVINSNYTAVMETEDFLKLDVKQVLEWVSSDDIIVNAEEDVFKGIVRWVSHSKSEREGDFPELLHQVRVASVSYDFLVKELVKEELITKNAEFGLSFVVNAMTSVLNAVDGDISQKPRKCLDTHMDGIFVCGGRKALCFFPKQNLWYRLADTPFHYQGHTLTQHKNKIYIFNKSANELGESQVTEHYKPAANSWGAVQTSETFTNQTNNCTVLKDVLYATYFDQHSEGRISRYDADMNIWYEMCAPPIRLSDPCVVGNEEYLYVIGGLTWLGNSSATTRFDPSSNKWEHVANINEARQCAFGAAMNGQVYIAGGGKGGQKAISSCEVYTPSTDVWLLMPSLKLPRFRASMVCCKGRLYVLGGLTCQFGSSVRALTVEEFDSERNEWADKSVIPVESFGTSDEEGGRNRFKACFARLYKGVIDKLKPLT